GERGGEGKIEGNSGGVKGGLLGIKKGDPDAVIMIAPYKPAAEFIKLARQIKLNATCVNISFVGSDALAKELGAGGAGTVVTQVVPFPRDAAIPVVAKYHAALKASAAGDRPGLVWLEGSLVAGPIGGILDRMGGERTRQGFIEAVQKSGGLDVDGFKLAYGLDNNRGSNQVYLTVIQADGSFKAVTKLEK